MSDYRYYLKPIGNEANEAIAALLNQLGESAFTCEVQQITVNDKTVDGVYEVPRHGLLTIVGHSVHKKNVRAYVQKGEGKIRPYRNYLMIGKKLRRTNAVRKAAASLDALKLKTV